MNGSRPSRPASGFSLVEMMIAMTLGVFLLGGLIQIFLNSKDSYRMLANLSRVQENGRIALDMMSKDLRMAGFLPCKIKAGQVANVLKNGDSWYLDFFNGALKGYEGGVSTFPTGIADEGTDPGDRVAGSDAIVILGGGNELYSVASHNAPSAQFDLDRNRETLEDGDIVLVCDATTASLFQMTGPTGTNSNVVHNTGLNSPGNCTKYLGYPSPSPCNDATGPLDGTAHTFGTDATLVKFDGRAYFIGVSQAGTSNALYKQSLINTNGTIGTSAEELVEDVDSMQILYGEDNDGDDEVEHYLTADLVSDWNDVVSVRVGLLVRSPDNFRRGETDTKTYNVAATQIASSGTTVTHAADRRIRQVFTTTVKIRNRGRMGE